jgi:hypothetical protein
MRVRRTGSTAKTGKPGRPREYNPYMWMAREVMDQHWSPRTQARYAAAMENLDQCSAKARIRVVEACTRPNGSINVSQLLEYSLELWELEHPSSDD